MAQLNPKEMQQALALPFAPEDLEWRLQNTIEEKMRGLAVPYVTNRAIQNRLDEVCGPENWYNDFKPWHSNGKKEAQLCGIAIYFEGRGFITKWDGAEDSDIESVKGGLSDSMKRAAVQWGIGRVLYDLNTVWVEIEKRGRSFVIKDSERARLDNAYLSALKRLGLTPAAACGIQSLLTPKTLPGQTAPEENAPAASPQPKQGNSQPAPASALQRADQPATRSDSQQTQPVQQSRAAASRTVPFTPPQRAARQRTDCYVVLSTKVQGGMSGRSTLVTLRAPDGKQIPYYKGVPVSTFGEGSFYWNEAGRLVYAGKDFSTRFGIDVSAYQNRAIPDKTIDWNAAKADGVEYAFVRIGLRGTSTGGLNADAFYAQNLDGAAAAGIDTGVYFFSQAITVEEAVEEANYVLSLLGGRQLACPVAYDWEMHDSTYRVYGTEPEVATACAKAFCDRIAQAGYEPMVYVSRYVGYFKFDLRELSGIPLWYPEYKYESTAPEKVCPQLYYRMDYWQYTNKLKVDGIGGNVDGSLRFYW